MNKFFVLLILFIFFNNICLKCNAEEYLYILNEKELISCYERVLSDIDNSQVEILKSPLGVIIRFELDNPLQEMVELSSKTKNILRLIEKTLAKNKKTAIIEVHTDKNTLLRDSELKNWELSTIISNKIEDYFLKNNLSINRKNISSIGYGEFLPVKNTSNNGGKYYNRVDIILLCNINGE